MAIIETLNIAHVNLGKTRAACIQINQIILEENLHLISINEPYCTEGVVGYISGELMVIANSPHARAGIIITRKDLHPVIIHLTEDFVVIKIQYRNKDIVVGSFYWEPSGDLDSNLEELERMMNNHTAEPMIWMGDFNAKSTRWGKSLEDERGEKLREFIDLHNIDILNDPNSLPTFDSSRGKSWIDLIIWKSMDFQHETIVKDIITTSDHNIITCIISDQNEQVNINPSTININKLNWNVFDDKLDTYVREVPQTSEGPEKHSDTITEAIRNIAMASSRPKRQIRHRNTDWWNGEL